MASSRYLYLQLLVVGGGKREGKMQVWVGGGGVFDDCVAVARVERPHLSISETRPCIRTASHTTHLITRAKITWHRYDGVFMADETKRDGGKRPNFYCHPWLLTLLKKSR